MKIIDKLEGKITGGVMGAAGSVIKRKIKSTIKSLIKEERLVYLENGDVEYTDRQGEKRVISIEEMTMILVDASGSANLLNVGIMPDDITNLIIEERGDR